MNMGSIDHFLIFYITYTPLHTYVMWLIVPYAFEKTCGGRMFDWLKNKLIQANITRYKEEMEEFWAEAAKFITRKGLSRWSAKYILRNIKSRRNGEVKNKTLHEYRVLLHF